MYQEEFKQWLEANGARTPQGRSTRTHAVKTIEAQLAALGSTHVDLDAAYAADRFEGLRIRLKAMREDAQRGGKDFRILMPQSDDPLNRLSSWRSWLAQYGRFLEERGGGRNSDHFMAGMEQMRSIFLERMDDFVDMYVEDGQYWEVEKCYKYAARGDCLLTAFDQDLDEVECGRRLCKRLSQSIKQGAPLSWRTLSEVDNASPQLSQRFYGAIGRFARAVAGAQDRVDVTVLEETARALEALRRDGVTGLKRGEVLSVLLTIYGTLAPEECCWFKVSTFDRLGKLLLGKALFPGDLFAIGQFEEFQALLFRIRDVLDGWGWKPESLADVQGFVWVAMAQKWDTGDGMMRDADRIRQHVLDEYIAPARAAGLSQVELHVRAINDALSLNDGWPNICQALQGRKFLEIANLSAPERLGKDASPATRFIFTLGASEKPVTQTPISPVNLILYGPPGTGKTYATAREAVRLCNGTAPHDNEELRAEYARLVKAERIEFVTFHQNFSYEDFVEGQRPVQAREGIAGFHLKDEPGIFQRFADKARRPVQMDHADFEIGDRRIWKMSVGEAAKAEDSYLFEEAMREGRVLLGWGDTDWSDPRYASREAIFERVAETWDDDRPLSASMGWVKDPNSFRNRMQKGDIVIVSKGNSLFRAIGEVVGDYEYAQRDTVRYSHWRAVRWLWHDRAGEPVEKIYTKGFSMGSIYELFRDRIDMEALADFIARGQGAAADQGPPEPFVLIIDEINRANISKVFGELITLLEPDKRIGADNELRVRLPYSKAMFGVPANLHIIGTMNTADRSIALLDTALRRRFQFRELMPDPLVLGMVDGVDLSRLLATLNGRIEYLFDREHQVGHAYFMDCRSRADIDATMRYKIIPLLSEYFYEDWGKVAAVLGDAGGAGRFVARQELTAPPGTEDEGEGARYRWTLREPFAADAYAGLM